MVFKYIMVSQPDLSGALFTNFAWEKPWEICKKAGTEGGKSCPKKNYSYLCPINFLP